MAVEWDENRLGRNGIFERDSFRRRGVDQELRYVPDSNASSSSAAPEEGHGYSDSTRHDGVGESPVDERLSPRGGKEKVDVRNNAADETSPRFVEESGTEGIADQRVGGAELCWWLGSVGIGIRLPPYRKQSDE